MSGVPWADCGKTMMVHSKTEDGSGQGIPCQQGVPTTSEQGVAKTVREVWSCYFSFIIL